MERWVSSLLPRGELAELGVALQVQLGVGEVGLVLRLLGLRLIERGLEGPGIDLGQEVALLDELAFLEGDLVDLAIDAGSDQDGVEGLHGSKAGQIDRKIRLFDGRNVHRAQRVAGTFLRIVCRCFLIFAMEALPAVIAGPSSYQGQQNPTRYPRFFHVGLQISKK